jgi:hypothetical protein
LSRLRQTDRAAGVALVHGDQRLAYQCIGRHLVIAGSRGVPHSLVCPPGGFGVLAGLLGHPASELGKPGSQQERFTPVAPAPVGRQVGTSIEGGNC